MPGYPRPASNGFGITALVLGIVAVFGCTTVVGGIPLGIAAIVFGALGRGKASRGEATNGGMALAGIILGGVGVLLGIGMTLLMFFLPALDDSTGDTVPHGPASISQVDAPQRARV
ncbi:DUF4190 domain-containing protein [Streptomyces sp. NPDC048551]|uniref:DUF4190 domain-containing protein n=1 Tax=Streptomyces sp. NPDC048551 TaxID=3155758 RepID=UPI003431D586